MNIATATPALEVRQVSKTFGGRRVLEIEQLTVGHGEIHALLGQNGSGKSTLIKILAGYHEPDPGHGSVVLVGGAPIGGTPADGRRDAGLRFVHQDLGLVAEMSVLDNMYLGRDYPTLFSTIRSGRARARARVALARAGLEDIDLAARVGELSPSERTGVAIARALAAEDNNTPTVLVLDEPTATLPAPEVERLLATLAAVARTGVAILYVTHHLEEVFLIADRVSVLRDGKTVATAVTSLISRDEIVHHLVGAELEAAHRGVGTGSVPASDDALLIVEGLGAPMVDSVTFELAAGEIVGFHGVTGSGRDTVLGAVFGRLARASGKVFVDGVELPSGRPDRAIRSGVGYLPANRKGDGAVMSMTATENISLPSLRRLWRRGRLDTARERSECDQWFLRLDVRPGDGGSLPMSSFSGGNQQKIVLAKWLRQDPSVFLLDEPTQGVDIGAKAVIHRTILLAASSGVAFAVASSDVDELAALCSTVHIMRRGRIVDTVRGDDITDAELNRRLNAVEHRDDTPGGVPE